MKFVLKLFLWMKTWHVMETFKIDTDLKGITEEESIIIIIIEKYYVVY